MASILSQSDISFGGDTASWDPEGSDGAARLHADLTGGSGPLTGEGTYCREWGRDNASSNESELFCRVNSTVESSAFANPPDSHGLSVRAWVRIAPPSAGSAVQAYLIIKSPVTAPFTDFGSNAYALRFGNNDNFGTELSGNLQIKLSTTTSSAGDDTTHPMITCTASVDYNTWTKIRMDVIPTAGMKDTIRIYSGSGVTGAETWEILAPERVILSTDTAYQPWGATKYCGWGIVSGENGPSSDGLIQLDRIQFFSKSTGSL
jgi:hypothetical protein